MTSYSYRFADKLIAKPVKIDHIFDNYYIPGTLNKNYCSWLYNK